MSTSTDRLIKVLLVTGEYPPTVGGVADYTRLLAHHLRDVGVAPSVLSSRAPAPRCTDVQAIPVHRVVRDWDFGSWREIADHVARARPDILHVQYQAGAFDGRAAIPLLPLRFAGAASPHLVVTFHDLQPPYLFPKAGRLRRVALRYLAREATGVIVTNGEDLARMPPRRTLPPLLIPIGSNIPQYQGDHASATRTIRQRLGLPGDTFLLAFFGLLGASKGVETLLTALRRLNESGPRRYHLLVVGGQSSSTDWHTSKPAALPALVSGLGLTGFVHETGQVDPAAVAEFLSGSDLVVLPYRDGASWRHGSLLAALKQGRPTIVTPPPAYYDGGGRLPRFADGKNTLLAPRGDAGVLASIIARVAADPALLHEVGCGARELASQFSWAAIAARHAAFYQHVLGRGAAA